MMANQQKAFVPLENNPEVMTKLAHKLGLSEGYAFHDVYSLTDPDLLALVPRPALALLFIYPTTAEAEKYYAEENTREADYDGTGGEPVLFYRQRIVDACGLIGLLHCITNPTRSAINAGSDLDILIKQALPLKPEARAQLLVDSDMLEAAHGEAAQQGQSEAPPPGQCGPSAFIAFAKGSDGHLYELEGRRKGPVDRGALPADADVLSEEALRLGPLPFIQREEVHGGNLLFSCTVLAKAGSE